MKTMFKNPKLERIARAIVKNFAPIMWSVVLITAIFWSVGDWRASRDYYFEPLPKQELVQNVWLPPYFANITKDDRRGFADAVQHPGMVLTVPLEELQRRHDPKGKNEFLVLSDGTVTYFSTVDSLTYQATSQFKDDLEWQRFCDAANFNSRLSFLRHNPRLEGSQLFYATVERSEWMNYWCFFWTYLWIYIKHVAILGFGVLAVFIINSIVLKLVRRYMPRSAAA